MIVFYSSQYRNTDRVQKALIWKKKFKLSLMFFLIWNDSEFHNHFAISIHILYSHKHLGFEEVLHAKSCVVTNLTLKILTWSYPPTPRFPLTKTFSTKTILLREKQKEHFNFTFPDRLKCLVSLIYLLHMLPCCFHLFNNRPQRRSTDMFLPNCIICIICINTSATHVIRVGTEHVPVIT